MLTGESDIIVRYNTYIQNIMRVIPDRFQVSLILINSTIIMIKLPGWPGFDFYQFPITFG